MIDAHSKLELSEAEFRLFSDLIRRRCGLHFDANTRFLLEKRLVRLIEESGATSVTSYLYRLRSGPNAEEEFWRLVDALTTNETYFFRERSQLAALITEIIPEMRTRRSVSGRPVAIWSAGCASGEEPFSIVMLGLEAGLEPGRDFRVYASDISRTALAKARRGVYREASFRETGDRLRQRYFSTKEGVSRISDEIKHHVDFNHMNLLDDARVSLLGPMDVILCRNVIIYFGADTKKRVMRTFHDKLCPGGYLLLGHAESLINVTTDFELKSLEHELVYRRPVPGEERLDRWHALARVAIEELERSEEEP
ncbi:MAG: protein-glutamate O-methyltransferase CheR [Deltaproteobacteria bacterium]|jgi:chemotaxis protein methyltransferase CheR|nr:protein-glutamate O-methyltransferase CheR [Deltaproteobacteria bacterium]MBW2501259.1 protein-glutamate O-methyltransferase CheR [Deltaproteobacteria bacterium]